MLEQRGSYLYRNGDVVGKLQRPYCIAVRDRSHYFRKFDGFSLAVESYEWLLNNGFIYFEVRYKPENRTFVFRVPDFVRGHRVAYQHYGEQYVLPITYSVNTRSMRTVKGNLLNMR